MNLLEAALTDLKEEYSCDVIVNSNRSFSGVNSHILPVTIKDTQYILKCFSAYETSSRYSRELEFLNFCSNNNLRCVPSVKSFAKRKNWLLLSVVPGRRPSEYNHLIATDIVNFLFQLNSLSVVNYPWRASDHMCAITDHYKSVVSRLHSIRLRYPYLSSLVAHDFSTCESLLESTGDSLLPFASEFDHQAIPILTQSDIGLHNILHSHTNSFFVDFEYAGLDHPIKTILDLLLQPSYPLPSVYIQSLIHAFNTHWDSELLKKLFTSLLTMTVIKWYLIKLKQLPTSYEPSDSLVVQTIRSSTAYLYTRLDSIPRLNAFLMA